jgi:mono/diheme cytochrome c family protein
MLRLIWISERGLPPDLDRPVAPATSGKRGKGASIGAQETAMSRLAIAAFLCAALGGLGAPVRAQSPAADVAAGRALSLRLCTSCHVVASGQENAPLLRPPAPDFRTIANRPGVSAAALSRFLRETHSSLRSTAEMPNPELTDDQVREAVAFLLRLRR